ncbi:MAG: DUF5110 domain-containing protein [Prevotella sp.]|nr:DUF5110 domain-containing protein [Prevotella sp.]
MKKALFFFLMLAAGTTVWAESKGRYIINTVAPNAVRIQYTEDASTNLGKLFSDNDNLIYVNNKYDSKEQVDVRVNDENGFVEIRNKAGKVVFVATRHQLRPVNVSEWQAFEAQLSFKAGQADGEEFQFGLGQFQDGFSNIFGLSRRLTQVNTQTSVPLMISSKGYGILWNNYGMTEFNPCDKKVVLTREQAEGEREVVNVTTTEGGKREIRERNRFTATIETEEAGEYAILLDTGQKMARRHHLAIDGQTVIDMQNLWLPPTASQIVYLTAGTHTVEASLTHGDAPVLYYKKKGNETVFRSPVAQTVDYTVFLGSPDEIIAAYRNLTGNAPMMPKWALGYIHCRERFHSSDEILQTANRFRNEQLPVDVIVQDWQYWGKYGWNSMTFDEEFYPDPKLLTDSLHAMNMRLMVSVWSKIDKNSLVGKQMLSQGHYIPDTDWIDFFNPKSAQAYWKHFSERLVPLGIDAWWQDATEPENDDLVGHRVGGGQYPGELFRNVYPLMVNKTVYEGLRKDQPDRRPMILTRSGYAGIQRYGTALWSGDVGNDWETFRRQITAGLGIQAAGIPWWTYDAGGFFRPGNQYQDQTYIHRMLRWIQTSVYLPLMRVHGYMSNTEPWNYGDEAKAIIAASLEERYRLLPYIYSVAADVSFNGSTLMRPLVFDFPSDVDALKQKYEYMFGKSLLISPVTEPDVKSWQTYLPKNDAGWYDYYTNQLYKGGTIIDTPIDYTHIPVFVKAGSILPYGPVRQFASEKTSEPIEIRVYPGRDATFTLYEDDGVSMDYEQGRYSKVTFNWNDRLRKLVIDKRQGNYRGTNLSQSFKIVVAGGNTKTIRYTGKKKLEIRD